MKRAKSKNAQVWISTPARAEDVTGGRNGGRTRKVAVRPAPPEDRDIERHGALIEATVDVGLGNTLFIRGDGGSLTWDKGQPLQCVEANRWMWTAPLNGGHIEFKLLLNDVIWAQGENIRATIPGKVEVTPVFHAG
jgi:hypothetical protein